MEQKILDALRIHFPDVQGDVTLEPTTEQYNGHILSEAFKGMSLVHFGGSSPLIVSYS